MQPSRVVMAQKYNRSNTPDKKGNSPSKKAGMTPAFRIPKISSDQYLATAGPPQR
jgi:hypothetical protein